MGMARCWVAEVVLGRHLGVERSCCHTETGRCDHMDLVVAVRGERVKLVDMEQVVGMEGAKQGVEEPDRSERNGS